MLWFTRITFKKHSELKYLTNFLDHTLLRITFLIRQSDWGEGESRNALPLCSMNEGNIYSESLIPLDSTLLCNRCEGSYDANCQGGI